MAGDEFLHAIAGGGLVGLASAALLVVTGRIAGVSGIVGGLLRPRHDDIAWRVLFVIGLVGGGAIVRLAAVDPFRGLATTPSAVLCLGGTLVGFGTSLGSGCTSGHGVCGVSRLSPRSIVATLLFMLAGGATVFAVRHLLGWRP
ncbi:MAG TPA: YeeE/YedE family protein [Candidatus Binatia bacterium]|jgi:hypothetical protein